MEPNLHQDYSNKTSSWSEEEEEEEEETNRSNNLNDDVGTGRSYECVFCKRGFTTAQALGGHMNIHRKDRTNKPSRPTSSSVSTLPCISTDDCYASFRGYPPIQTYPSPHYSAAAHHHEVLINYQTSFPATWGFRPPHDDLYIQSTQLLNHRFDDDWGRHSLSLQIGPSSSSSASHMDVGAQEIREDGSEANELDLELRLGHHCPSP